MKSLVLASIVALIVGTVAPHASAEQEYARGAVLLEKGTYEKIPMAPLPVRGPLPASVTLERDMPPPGKQGDLGSCTAWAVSYAKAYRIFRANGGKGRPGQYAQSPAFIYSAITEGKCNVGTSIPKALKFLQETGSVPLSRLPYSDTFCPSWKSVQPFADNKSVEAYRLSSEPKIALNQIRNHLAAGDPVIVAINTCGELERPDGSHVMKLGSSNCGGHAVLVVGFDDNAKALRILNSWGTEWGDNGKAWVSYEVFYKQYHEGYIDFGPGPVSAEDLAPMDPMNAEGKRTTELLRPSASELVRGLRTNIDSVVIGMVMEGERQRPVSRWSIWLNLPKNVSGSIKNVGYYFLHPTFKHNPQKSIRGSNIFLAEWRGYGCVREAYLIAELTDGSKVRADFDFCEVQRDAYPGDSPRSARVR